MRDYGRVYSRFWSSRDMRALSEDGRYLALYLMTCGHCTLAGIFHLPDGYVCEDTQWTPERAARGFAELLRKGFATRCDVTKWVWIIKHLDWNRLQNPNQGKAAAKILEEVPSECCWLADFQRVLEEVISNKGQRFRKGSRTVTQPLPNRSETTTPVSEQLANGSATVPQPVSVSVSVSESVSVAVTVPVRLDADGEDADGERAGQEGGQSNLNGNGADHEPVDPSQPAGFAMLRQLYPERSGSQRWADALENYLANLKAGYSPQQMLDGVMRYARYCRVEDLLGKPKVQQAATFLGPNRGFLEPWTPSTKRETAGERWAREGASDASH